MKDVWQHIALSELTAHRPICYGVLKPGERQVIGVPLLRITDITNDELNETCIYQITPELSAEFKRSVLEGNEVLLSIQGTIGRVAICPPHLKGANISRTLALIAPDRRLDRPFLRYWLLSLNGEFPTCGSTRASLNIGALRELRVPVPPLPIQHRIVAILDKALDGIATAKANAEKNVQNVHAMFESYLQAVFTQRGLGWVEMRLKAVTTKIGSGATPRGGEEAYKAEGISLIRSLNVHDMGFRYQKLALIDDAQAYGLSNVVVQLRDVLLNITGASIARCCLVPNDVLPARVNQHVSIIRPIAEKLDAEFLHYLLISKPYKDQLLATGEEGGSTRQAITKAQIQEFAIEYPADLKEQRAIVAKLDALTEETQRLESIYQQKLAALDALKTSLLHQAFSGQLSG